MHITVCSQRCVQLAIAGQAQPSISKSFLPLPLTIGARLASLPLLHTPHCSPSANPYTYRPIWDRSPKASCRHYATIDMSLSRCQIALKKFQIYSFVSPRSPCITQHTFIVHPRYKSCKGYISIPWHFTPTEMSRDGYVSHGWLSSVRSDSLHPAHVALFCDVFTLDNTTMSQSQIVSSAYSRNEDGVDEIAINVVVYNDSRFLLLYC